MATYERIANLKGPKGNGVTNPRVVGDNLVMDQMDGTEVSETGVVVGNVRGPQGPQGPAPTLAFSATAGGENLAPEAVTTKVTGGYKVELKNLKGRTPEITASAETVTGEATATASPTTNGAHINFGVPKGEKGDRGPIGATPKLAFSVLAGDPSLPPRGKDHRNPGWVCAGVHELARPAG